MERDRTLFVKNAFITKDGGPVVTTPPRPPTVRELNASFATIKARLDKIRDDLQRRRKA